MTSGSIYARIISLLLRPGSVSAFVLRLLPVQVVTPFSKAGRVPFEADILSGGEPKSLPRTTVVEFHRKVRQTTRL